MQKENRRAITLTAIVRFSPSKDTGNEKQELMNGEAEKYHERSIDDLIRSDSSFVPVEDGVKQLESDDEELVRLLSISAVYNFTTYSSSEELEEDLNIEGTDPETKVYTTSDNFCFICFSYHSSKDEDADKIFKFVRTLDGNWVEPPVFTAIDRICDRIKGNETICIYPPKKLDRPLQITASDKTGLEKIKTPDRNQDSKLFTFISDYAGKDTSYDSDTEGKYARWIEGRSTKNSGNEIVTTLSSLHTNETIRYCSFGMAVLHRFSRQLANSDRYFLEYMLAIKDSIGMIMLSSRIDSIEADFDDRLADYQIVQLKKDRLRALTDIETKAAYASANIDSFTDAEQSDPYKQMYGKVFEFHSKRILKIMLETTKAKASRIKNEATGIIDERKTKRNMNSGLISAILAVFAIFSAFKDGSDLYFSWRYPDGSAAVQGFPSLLVFFLAIVTIVIVLLILKLVQKEDVPKNRFIAFLLRSPFMALAIAAAPTCLLLIVNFVCALI